MEEELRAESTALPSGGLLRLRARATDFVTWLVPAWAVLCGVSASGGFTWQGPDWLRLALLVLLVDGGWGSIWAALVTTDWATPLGRWREWNKNRPTATLPYTLPHAPGGRLSHFMGRLRAWWSEVLWPNCGAAVLTVLIALPTTALLGTLLGMELLLVSVAALAVMELGVIWGKGRGVVPPGWDATIAMALPWLAGHLTFAPITLPSAALAVLFALAWGKAWSVTSAWGRALTVGGQLLAGTSLVALRRPLAAGGLFLLLVPQLAYHPWIGRDYRADWYVRQARPWMMAAMLVAALAV
ncbi:MAG: hypothetical protein ACOC7N_01625 [Chloroflexota bacterium]